MLKYGRSEGTCLTVLILAACLSWNTRAQEVPQFGIFETALEATTAEDNPYATREAMAKLVRPDGKGRSIPLFWDGGAVWKLRFSPDVPGTWSYTIDSEVSGLGGQRGSFVCAASDKRGSIKRHEGHPAHLQYQDGTPMWFLGDTAWGLVTTSEEDAYDRKKMEHYVDTRAAQGFNAMHTMLLSEAGWGNDGGAPFHDMAAQTINPAYWREVDARIAYANRRGIVVGLAIAWGDKRGVEPYAWSRFPDAEARMRYARYIAARYSAYDVYFILSGEWHAEPRARKTSQDAVAREFVRMGAVLAGADPHGRMKTIHPMTARGSVREFSGAAWAGFADYQQNYANLHERTLLSRTIGGPVVNSEYGYLFRDSDGDGTPDKDNSVTTEHMRHASWDIVMAGGYLVTGFGTTYFGGHRDPGPFDVDTKKNDEWETQIGYIKRLFEYLPWYRLVPADALLSCDTPRGSDRRTSVAGKNLLSPPETTYWAMMVPGDTYVVYLRGLETPVRLELDSRPGEFTVRWYSPITGEYRPAKDVEISGVHELRAPDKNDWVCLVMRSNPWVMD